MAFERRQPGQTGAQQLATLRRSLEKGGWPAGLTLLTGEDRFHLDRAQRALLDALVPPAEQAHALTVYSGVDVDVSVVVAAARSVGMFAPSRVVLVRDAAVLTGRPEPLEEYAARPPARSFLIVRAPKLDRRRKLEAMLAARARVLVFDPTADPESAAAQIAKLAAERELTLDEEAAKLLALVSGGDFYRADAELEKLRCWLGGPGRLGVAALREVVAGSAVLSGWELADAVGQGDRRAALRAVRELLDAGVEPLLLVGGLAFRARAMLQAKAALEAGTQPADALREARLFGRPYRETLAGLARYRLRELAGFPAALLEADRALKGSALPPGPVLERLVERMTPAGPGRSGP